MCTHTQEHTCAAARLASWGCQQPRSPPGHLAPLSRDTVSSKCKFGARTRACTLGHTQTHARAPLPATASPSKCGTNPQLTSGWSPWSWVGPGGACPTTRDGWGRRSGELLGPRRWGHGVRAVQRRRREKMATQAVLRPAGGARELSATLGGCRVLGGDCRGGGLRVARCGSRLGSAGLGPVSSSPGSAEPGGPDVSVWAGRKDGPSSLEPAAFPTALCVGAPDGRSLVIPRWCLCLCVPIRPAWGRGAGSQQRPGRTAVWAELL